MSAAKRLVIGTICLSLVLLSGCATSTNNVSNTQELSAQSNSTQESSAQSDNTQEAEYLPDLSNASDESISIILGEYTLDENTTIDDYAKQYKESNNYIDVQPYDDSHIIVTMTKSDLEKLANSLDEMKEILNGGSAFDQYPGIIENFKCDDLMTDCTYYVNKDAYQNSDLGFNILLLFITASCSDAIQAANMVDVSNRTCSIKVVDNVNGDVLSTYPE